MNDQENRLVGDLLVDPNIQRQALTREALTRAIERRGADWFATVVVDWFVDVAGNPNEPDHSIGMNAAAAIAEASRIPADEKTFCYRLGDYARKDDPRRHLTGDPIDWQLDPKIPGREVVEMNSRPIVAEAVDALRMTGEEYGRQVAKIARAGINMPKGKVVE